MSYTQQITSLDTREYPWIQAGQAVGGASIDEILESGGLANWDIQAKPLFTADADRVPNHFGIVRGDTSDVLGVVGRRYRVHQNEEAFAPIQDILDSSDLVPETAGIKNNGQQVFLTLSIPEGISVEGHDAHSAKLLAVTSHDGSLATTFAVMVGRLACFNALRPTLRTSRKFSVRHTANSAIKINDAREALGLTFSYLDEFEEKMKVWLDTPMSDAKMERVVEQMLPIREGLSEGRARLVEERRGVVLGLFKDSPTNEFGRGTKYAAYNALNEYSNWHMPMRGDDPTKRALRVLDDDSAVAKFDAKAESLLALA